MTTMEAPMQAATMPLPSNYAIAARPAHPRVSLPVPARLVADLEATLRSGQALAFPVGLMSDKQVNRMAARLNGIGRRAGRDFAVRTRKSGDQLYAWASAKPAPRTRKPKGAEDVVAAAE
jgi:hypothetical protein